MSQLILILPIALVFGAAAVAALFGLPGPNRRIPIERLSMLLAAVPLVAFVLLALPFGRVSQGEVLTWQMPWLPALDLSLGFYYDSLSALFALLVTFIGTLVVLYSGQYFKGDPGAWRFLSYLFLFMGSMLGLVMAGDVITLFIFWEGTSITSYLLVAYKTADAEARRGAFKALFITGGGGIALLAGLLAVAAVTGSTDFAAILQSGDALRSHELYLVMLALVAFGAFTKSAQFPAHIWLPGAMSAPTPASAYLHSATMVKAGIYLLARFNPALGFTEEWFWLLTLTGMITMLAGAYLGLKQNDLKALLAYSTICQLGILVMLVGQDDATAFKALVIGILAHALYKSALFLVAGSVDHETGTRDLRRLGGLYRVMPFTFAVGIVAAFSMAGLPPLFGFLAKETLLATSLHPSLPPLVSQLFTLSTVVAGALLLAQSGLLIWETFLGKPKDAAIHAHEAPALMWLVPAIPALLSLVLAQLPGVQEEAAFLASAASTAFGEPVKVSLKMWQGLNVPFLLSLVAISLGLIIFLFRHRVRSWQMRVPASVSLDTVYRWTLRALDGIATRALRLQQGRLRPYLQVVIVGTVALVVLFSVRQRFPALLDVDLPEGSFFGEVLVLRVFLLMVIAGASLASVILRRDFAAVLALGASGLGIALWMLLEPAPGVAVVQIVVDILSMVILVLALTRLPRVQRRLAEDVTHIVAGNRLTLLRDALVAAAVGLVVTLLTLAAGVTVPRESVPTPYFAANAKTMTGTVEIVGAIVADFRALDTLIEIAVFSMAGLGIWMLLRYAVRSRKDGETQRLRVPLVVTRFPTYGIGGPRASALIRVGAFATLPLSLVLAAIHLLFGHTQPGDGFTAGVIVGLAVGLWYVVFGYTETRQRLTWLRPNLFIAAGILLAISNAIVAALITGSFMGNADYSKLAGLPLPGEFHISTSFLFEVSICLAVLGSVAHMLNALGHPSDPPDEPDRDWQQVSGP